MCPLVSMSGGTQVFCLRLDAGKERRVRDARLYHLRIGQGYCEKFVPWHCLKDSGRVQMRIYREGSHAE